MLVATVFVPGAVGRGRTTAPMDQTSAPTPSQQATIQSGSVISR